MNDPIQSTFRDKPCWLWAEGEYNEILLTVTEDEEGERDITELVESDRNAYLRLWGEANQGTLEDMIGQAELLDDDR